MENNYKNTSFIQPEDLDQKVWRYLDLGKLLSLVQTNKLYLTRADFFSDIFECSFPVKMVDKMNNCEKNGSISFMGTSEDRSKLKKSFYVNCWRIGSYESDAMWKLYCPDGIGVAIITSYRKLRDSIPDNCYIGLVTYLDYQKDTFKSENRLEPIIHKRNSYLFEQEVRIVLPNREYWTSDGNQNNKEGELIDFNLSSIVEEVVVSPYAQKWYHDVVANIPEVKNLLRDWSELRSSPTY